ncbi:MAG: hypothetical protein C4332_05415, partial [Meiothermus sp.]
MSIERPVDFDNLAYLEALYQEYQQNPSSIPQEWTSYFAATLEPTPNGAAAQSATYDAGSLSELASFFLKAVRLIRAFRE